MYNINLKDIETITKCPSCLNRKTAKISDVYYKNNLIFFSTSFCENCSLIFRSKRPNEKSGF